MDPKDLFAGLAARFPNLLPRAPKELPYAPLGRVRSRRYVLGVAAGLAHALAMPVFSARALFVLPLILSYLFGKGSASTVLVAIDALVYLGLFAFGFKLPDPDPELFERRTSGRRS